MGIQEYPANAVDSGILKLISSLIFYVIITFSLLFNMLGGRRADSDDDKDEDYEYCSDDDDDDDGERTSRVQRNILRHRNISIEGDRKICEILRSMNLYKFLRRKIGGEPVYSMKEAIQIMKRFGSFLAYIDLNYGEDSVVTESKIRVLMRAVLNPRGHFLLYEYVEYLAALKYKPNTLRNTIRYVSTSLQWAYNCNSDCRQHLLQSFQTYAQDLSKKVIFFYLNF